MRSLVRSLFVWCVLCLFVCLFVRSFVCLCGVFVVCCCVACCGAALILSLVALRWIVSGVGSVGECNSHALAMQSFLVVTHHVTVFGQGRSMWCGVVEIACKRLHGILASTSFHILVMLISCCCVLDWSERVMARTASTEQDVSD